MSWLSASKPRWRALSSNGLLASAWTCAIALTVVCIAGGAGPWFEAIADFFGKRDPFWVREDFTAFYAAGKMVNEGMVGHLYHTEWIAWVERGAAGGPVGGTGMLPYFNPPFFALLFSPIAHLSLQQAYQVWNLFCAGLLVVNCLFIWKLSRPLGTPWRVVVLAGYLSLYPLLFGLRLGQFSLILQLSVAGAFLALRDGRDRLAGLSLALLLIKPELLIPFALYAAIKRRWRVFDVLIPLTTAAVVVSIAMIGWHEALKYPGYLMESTTVNGAGVAPDLMINWPGIIATSFGNGGSIVRPLLGALLGIASIGAVLWLSIRGREVPGRFALEWFALVLATMLADPHFYLQDTIIAAPAAIAALAAIREPERVVAGVLLAICWGIQRLALYPNQEMGVNLFAISVVIIFAATLAWLWYTASMQPQRTRAERRARDRSGAAQRSHTLPGRIPRDARRGGTA